MAKNDQQPQKRDLGRQLVEFGLLGHMTGWSREQLLDIQHLPLGFPWFELLIREFLIVSVPESSISVSVLGLRKALQVTVR